MNYITITPHQYLLDQNEIGNNFSVQLHFQLTRYVKTEENLYHILSEYILL